MSLTSEQKEKRRQDPHVQYVKSRICNKDSGKPYVFVSYKSDDWEPVLRDVVYRLVKEEGLNVYFDGDFDDNSTCWLQQFQNNMESPDCRGILVFLDTKYMTSYATVLELMYSQCGLATDSQRGMPLICIRLPSDGEMEPGASESTGLGNGADNINASSERDLFSTVVTILHERQIINTLNYTKFQKEQRSGTNGKLTRSLCLQIAKEVLSKTGIQEKDPRDIRSIVNTIVNDCGKEVFRDEEPVAAPAQVRHVADSQALASHAVNTPPAGDEYIYTLFGKTYHAGRREQGKLMYDTFEALAQRFPERIPALTRRTSVSRVEDVVDANTRQAKPTYFRICRRFTVDGQDYFVGISYGFAAKLAEIRGMLKGCGVSAEEFTLVQRPSDPARETADLV